MTGKKLGQISRLDGSGQRLHPLVVVSSCPSKAFWPDRCRPGWGSRIGVGSRRGRALIRANGLARNPRQNSWSQPLYLIYPMKTMLFVAFLVTVPVRGEASGSSAMREKLHAKIVESHPAPAPATPSDEKKESENAVVVMEPVVVGEPDHVRALDRLMTRKRQEKAERRFVFTKGGTIYSNSRLELGGKWVPEDGWKFLKISW